VIGNSDLNENNVQSSSGDFLSPAHSRGQPWSNVGSNVYFLFTGNNKQWPVWLTTTRMQSTTCKETGRSYKIPRR